MYEHINLVGAIYNVHIYININVYIKIELQYPYKL